MSLLSSPRSDEDIQLELVEIMGFEGDALTLVEELLKPGGRASVLKTINGASEMVGLRPSILQLIWKTVN